MCSKDMQRLRRGPRKTLRRPAAAICPPKAPEKGYAVQRLFRGLPEWKWLLLLIWAPGNRTHAVSGAACPALAYRTGTHHLCAPTRSRSHQNTHHVWFLAPATILSHSYPLRITLMSCPSMRVCVNAKCTYTLCCELSGPLSSFGHREYRQSHCCGQSTRPRRFAPQ